MPSPMGCAEGLAPCLIGEFSAIRQYCGSDKFPNKLRYFLRKYPAACRPSARLPFGGGCPCRLLARNPHLIFSLSVGGWRGGRFRFQRLLLHGAVGYKVFPINTLAAKREEDLSGNGAAA